MILIACATGKELGFFKPPAHVEMLVTGVGPVEAAAALSRTLAQSRYALVVAAGIAGAFPGAANVGDGVVVSEELFELGLETGDPICLPEGQRAIEAASSDLSLVERLVELGFACVRGVTVSRVTATSATARRLAARGAGVESMEGFAVLRAAEIAGVAAVELRGISNIAGERAASAWNFDEGVRGLERILTALLAATGDR